MSSTIKKSDITSELLLINGTPIIFSISFDFPSDKDIYQSFQIIDVIPEGIAFNQYDTVVKAEGSLIPGWNFEYGEKDRKLIVNINNSDLVKGKKVEAIVATKLEDKDKIDKDTLTLTNTAEVLVNKDASLATLSSEAKVQFKEVQDGEIVVVPESQNNIVQSVVDNNVQFSVFFNAVKEDENHKNYNVATILPEGMTFVEENSSVILKEKKNSVLKNADKKLKVVRINSSSIDVNYDYDENTRKLIVTIANSLDLLENEIYVQIGTKIEKPSKDKVVFTVGLGFNDPSIIVSSQEIMFNYIKPISITETVDNQLKLLENNIPALYKAKFTIPSATSGGVSINTFNITDNLPDGLAFDLGNSSVITSDGKEILSNVIYPKDKSEGLIEIQFGNYSDLQGEVTVNIAAVLKDITKLPNNLTIANQIELTINGEISSKTSSNIVNVRFMSKSELEREQALINVMESIALIEQGLAAILYAEGDEVKLAETLAQNSDDIIKVNNSIDETVSSITVLERILINKLKKAGL